MTYEAGLRAAAEICEKHAIWLRTTQTPADVPVAIDNCASLIRAAIPPAEVEPQQSDEQRLNKIEAACRKSRLFNLFMEQQFWHAHHVDLLWRFNGEDVREQADWLKDVWYAIRRRIPVPAPAEGRGEGLAEELEAILESCQKNVNVGSAADMDNYKRLRLKAAEAIAALRREQAELPHPSLQMAAGGHTIGVFRDGKLIAADADVLAAPPLSEKEG